MQNILIIDNDEALRDVLGTELTTEGFTVFPIINTENDVNEFLKGDKIFHLVILDITEPKPGFGDFKVMDLIRTKKPEVKIIVLTSLATLRNAIESTKRGVFDFISKPYDLIDLLEIIDRAFNKTTQN